MNDNFTQNGSHNQQNVNNGTIYNNENLEYNNTDNRRPYYLGEVANKKGGISKSIPLLASITTIVYNVFKIYEETGKYNFNFAQIINNNNNILLTIVLHLLIILIAIRLILFIRDIDKKVIYKKLIIDNGKIFRVKPYRCEQCNAKTKLVVNNRGRWINVCSRSAEHNKRFDTTK